YRDVAQQHIASLVVLRKMLVQLAAKIRECDGHHIVATIDQAQREAHVLARLAILWLKIPSTFRLALGRPAVTDRSLRHDEVAGIFLRRDGLPCGTVRF